MSLPRPTYIWEIGSRDGREAQRLSDAFPWSQIIAFEPNPETFPSVENMALKNNRITPKNLAISKTNGLIDFYKINTSETVTSWIDGNPGASSLLKSSGNYPHETYVQELIQVRSIRASELLMEYPEMQPQLLWIDVQGSEDQVLESFGKDLEKVSLIVVELSLKEIYSNQPLALDVLEIIKNNFYFTTVLNVGEWQFDALLVNKNAPRKIKHWLLDRYFRMSLQTTHKIGIARNFPSISEVGKWLLGKGLRYIVDRSVEVLKRKKRSQAHFLTNTFLRQTNLNSKVLAHYARRLAEASLPSNPVKNLGVAPEISLLIPVVTKDSPSVNLVIQKALENSLNPISTITVVYAGAKPQIENSANVVIHIVPESAFIPDHLEEIVQKYALERQGWIRQQVIKFLGVGLAESNSTLICDSDTYLIQKRLWLNENDVQQLQVCHEFSEDYEQHYLDVFGESSHLSRKISYVTHHMLMQKSIINEMFGAGLEGITRWLENGNFESKSSISEFHTYGRFISERHPERCCLSSWNNLFVESTTDDLLGLLDSYSDKYCSVSMHKY